MPLELVIVSPDGEWFRGPVERVVLPGSEGEFGVLPGHEHFLCPLRVGEVEVHNGTGFRFAAVAGGFAQVTGDEVVVMVESCEFADRIDVARAELARDRAEQGLRSLEDPDAARYRQYEAALERARNRLRVRERAR